MQSGLSKDGGNGVKHRIGRKFSVIAVLIETCLAVVGCSDSVGPVPDLTGSWLGGSPVQIFIAFEQRGPTVKAAGQIATAGTSNGFLLPVHGVGTITSGSAVHLDLDGPAGHQLFEGKLLDTGIISGTISGDRIGGDGIQVITLARYSEPPAQL